MAQVDMSKGPFLPTVYFRSTVSISQVIYLAFPDDNSIIMIVIIALYTR